MKKDKHIFYNNEQWLEGIKKVDEELYLKIKSANTITFNKETLILTVDGEDFQLSIQ